MNTPSPYTIAGIAFSTSAILVALLLRYPDWLPDRPNERSLHARVIPRTGGIAIVVATLATWLALVPSGRLIAISALAISVVSAIDDWRGLSPLPRFSAQILAASAVIARVLDPTSVTEGLFLLLAIVWVTNLFNFMDGADGLAGGMAIGGFSAFAIAAWISGHLDLSLICVGIVGATIPFLVVNFSPARIFMGDSGSVTLGFLAAALGALGWREGAWSPFFPVFVFSPFIADASLTLLHRIVNRQKFWRPHRDHYYQKAIRLGLSHRKAALAEYLLIGLSGLLALAVQHLDAIQQLGVLLGWGMFLVLLAIWIDARWKEYCGSTEK